ncbi:MAG: hypothetical protein V3V99_12200 [candidate division Zixibacteria bacterium]
MLKIRVIIFLLLIVLILAAGVYAGNYVNWNGGFWLNFPDDWEKVDYRIVDRIFLPTDSTSGTYNYEAVFAPKTSPYLDDAYVVIAFDSIGTLSKQEADSLLKDISNTYKQDIYKSRVVDQMSDLIPGQPRLDLNDKSITVISEMAYRPEAMKKLMMHMKLNDIGMVTLYCYSPDSTFESDKAIFDSVIASLSFENLKEAAAQEELKFTDVGKYDSLDNPSSSLSEEEAAEPVMRFKNWMLAGVIVIIAIGLIWNFVILPRRKKSKEDSD